METVIEGFKAVNLFDSTCYKVIFLLLSFFLSFILHNKLIDYLCKVKPNNLMVKILFEYFVICMITNIIRKAIYPKKLPKV